LIGRSEHCFTIQEGDVTRARTPPRFRASMELVRNPQDPDERDDFAEPGTARRVTRGGS
jgi:hypothetical protein